MSNYSVNFHLIDCSREMDMYYMNELVEHGESAEYYFIHSDGMTVDEKIKAIKHDIEECGKYRFDIDPKDFCIGIKLTVDGEDYLGAAGELDVPGYC